MPRKKPPRGALSGKRSSPRHVRRGLPFASELPRVVLVGAVNSGKSSLFNKAIGRRQAVVTERPGTTRDWQIAEVRWAGRRFAIVDTGGLFGEEDEALRDQVFAKAEEALKGCHLAILVADAKLGVSGVDERISEFLRKGGFPTIVAVNKVDNLERYQDLAGFASLGWETLVGVSAIHGSGVGDLLDLCVADIEKEAERQEGEEGEGEKGEKGEKGDGLQRDLTESVSVAVVGIPNAGKSSLMNALLGRQRSIVHAKPGTTRDVLVDVYTWQDKTYLLADTAGIRKRSKVTDDLETITVSRSLGAAARCEVTVLVVDVMRGFTDQDIHLAATCMDKGSGLVIFGNKMDLMKDLAEGEERPDPEDMKRLMARPFTRLGEVPVILGSAMRLWELPQLKSAIATLSERQRKRIRTPELNDFLQEADGRGAFVGLSSPKILYGAQMGVCPAEFVIKVGRPSRITRAGITYITKGLIKRFNLDGCPIRIRFEGRKREK